MEINVWPYPDITVSNVTPCSHRSKKCSLISNCSPRSSPALTVLLVGDVAYRKRQAGGELRIGG